MDYLLAETLLNIVYFHAVIPKRVCTVPSVWLKMHSIYNVWFKLNLLSTFVSYLNYAELVRFSLSTGKEHIWFLLLAMNVAFSEL